MPTRTTKDTRVFKARLKGDMAEMRRKARIILDTLTFQLLALAAAGTPVDTGRLQSGWQAAAIVTDDQRPIGQVPDLGQVFAALADADLTDPRFVFNNVEYGVFQEKGTPVMRGAHMLENAVAQLARGGAA